MNKMRKFLIFIFLISTCFTSSIIFSNKEFDRNGNKSNQITIVIDTLDIYADGFLRKVVLFNNKFYCLFETQRHNTSQSYKKMIVYSLDGKFVEDVFIPKEIQRMPDYDLIVENDSLFLKESQFEKENFVLGRYVADFNKIGERDFKIYQDEDYNVYSSCCGEWGGTVFFQNRITKKVYDASSTCPIVVNKIKNDYYVTNYLDHMIGYSSILKIPDPTKMQQSKLNFEVNKGSDFELGTETILDTTDIFIATSFVLDNSLYHLYSDNDGNYIGKIEGQKLVKIKDFGFKFYTQFNQQLTDSRQILNCFFKEDEKNGILIIDKNNFHFYRFR